MDLWMDCLISSASCSKGPYTQDGVASPRFKGMTSSLRMDYTTCRMHILALVWFQFNLAGNRSTTWDAQASWQMMTCLMNFCSPECFNKPWNSSNNHTVTSKCGEVSEDGPLFLCILILRVVVDNRSTISYYSHQLTCLDPLMTKRTATSPHSMMRYKHHLSVTVQWRNHSTLDGEALQWLRNRSQQRVCVIHPTEEVQVQWRRRNPRRQADESCQKSVNGDDLNQGVAQST